MNISFLPKKKTKLFKKKKKVNISLTSLKLTRLVYIMDNNMSLLVKIHFKSPKDFPITVHASFIFTF